MLHIIGNITKIKPTRVAAILIGSITLLVKLITIFKTIFDFIKIKPSLLFSSFSFFPSFYFSINPIQELQMIGRRDNYDGNEDSDEPPFNFQVRLL